MLNAAATPAGQLPHPSAHEDRDVAHESFLKAIAGAKSDAEAIPGLQDFAAGVWERRKRIPSSSFNDPLARLFREFDVDSDGHLTAAEVAGALRSRGVGISDEQAQRYVDAADGDGNATIELAEFGALIYRMAVADLTGKIPPRKQRADDAQSAAPAAAGPSPKAADASFMLQYVMQRDPSLLSVPGLQGYAAELWDRRRRVPPGVRYHIGYQDPLAAVFAAFDADGDGSIDASELRGALASRGVRLSEQQAQLAIDAVDLDGNGKLEAAEFSTLLFGLATAGQLAPRQEQPGMGGEQPGVGGEAAVQQQQQQQL